MKVFTLVLISICLLKLVVGECYNENPGQVSTCEKEKSGNSRCCLVEFRNNFSPDYRKICVPIKEEDIADGKFEATVKLIETGNYTGSNWSDTILANFRNYSSIDNFDCKGEYLSKIFYLICSMIIFALL